MARLPRLYLPGCAQHAIQRGSNQEACFYHEADGKAYLSFLKDAANTYQVAIHAFVLMTNHVHLVVTPADEKGVSRMMQTQGRQYVRHFNYTHSRTDTLWKGRYKSTLVDAEHYLLAVYRCSELNPVRTGMASHAAEYPWSNCRGSVLGKAIQLLTPHPLYGQAGRPTWSGKLPTARCSAVRCRIASLRPYAKRPARHGCLATTGSKRRSKPGPGGGPSLWGVAETQSRRCIRKREINDSDRIDSGPH